MTKKQRIPWLWVPSLAFSDGLPLVAVMSVSVILYKQLGLSNSAITFYTSWMYLPWILKPVWSPFIDLVKTKRWWVLAMYRPLRRGIWWHCLYHSHLVLAAGHLVLLLGCRLFRSLPLCGR